MKILIQYFLLFLVGGLGVSAKADTSPHYTANLLTSSYELLNSNWDLFMDNFLAKKNSDGIYFYGQKEKLCTHDATGDSSHFDDRVLEYRESIKKGEALFIFRSCLSEDRSFQIRIQSESISEHSPRQQVWKLLKSLELKASETKRIISIGQIKYPDDFKIIMKKKANKTSLTYSVRAKVLFRSIHDKKLFRAKGFPGCVDFRMVYGEGRSCFGGSSIEVESKLINSQRNYFIEQELASKTKFEKVFSNHLQFLFLHTIDAFTKRFMQTMPKVQLRQASNTETEFEKDLRQAYQRLLIGDLNISTILIRKNIDKLEKNKVRIQEVD